MELLIATQDQAVHAIRGHVDRPGVDPALTAVVHGVLAVHVIDPPEEAGKPWADCGDCDGTGVVVHLSEDGVATRHCHCQCPWCEGCDESLCSGPCPTVEAMARALGLLPEAPALPCGAFQPAQPPGMAYRCSAPQDHLGDHVATIDGAEVARWAASTNLPEGEDRA